MNAATTTREKLSFDDAEAFQALCGQENKRLKLLERTLGVGLHVRGNEITIEGERAAVAQRELQVNSEVFAAEEAERIELDAAAMRLRWSALAVSGTPAPTCAR